MEFNSVFKVLISPVIFLYTRWSINTSILQFFLNLKFAHEVHSYIFSQTTQLLFPYTILAVVSCINTLNPELNPICHLLALLGAHHILHVSRIRAKIRNKFLNILCNSLFKIYNNISLYINIQGDQKVSVHLMIKIQKVTSNVQSVPRQSSDIY